TLQSREQLRQLANAMGLQVAVGAPARRLLEATLPMGTDAATAVLQAHDRTLIEPHHEPVPAQAALSRGLADLRAALAANPLRLGEVLNLVLDTMHRALDFRWVVLCLRDPKTGQLVGRLGLGLGAADISPAFRIGLGGATHGDLFAALCAKGADLLIKDATAVVGHLPHWYRQRVNAGSFMVMPLQLQGRCIGLIYADKMAAGSIVLHEGELALLRALRDEAVAAFKRGQ
ncbi:MAG TPA: GAF domain-containing protein, partial [Rubrivivax sp.]|nr:GAF domain-containing protein [Rubrivivax sp.]